MYILHLQDGCKGQLSINEVLLEALQITVVEFFQMFRCYDMGQVCSEESAK